MRKNIAIGLVSAAIIAYQLVVMQIFAFTQWHHFGFMVISVALLGFGAAGTFLSIYSDRFINKDYIPWIIVATGFLMILAVPFSQSELIRFDSLLVFTNFSEKIKLTVVYMLYFLPFFSGALAIGIYFIEQKQIIGKAYFTNLIGSALGGIFILFLMWQFKTYFLSFIVSAFVFIAALIIRPANKKKLYYSCVFFGIVILVLYVVDPVQYKPSQFKALTKSLLLPDASIVVEKSSPYGTFHVIESNLLRHAPGLSLNYQYPLPQMQTAYVNGNWAGALEIDQKADSNFFLRSSVFELPFRLISPNKILVLGAGEGTNLSLALDYGKSNITGVDANPFVIDWIKDSNPTILVNNQQPGLKIYQEELRSFLMRDTTQFDLIMFPVLGAFGGTSGVNAIQEDYLMTVESIKESWFKLSENGIISFSTWIDFPSRYPLKLLATIKQALVELKIAYPEQHIVSIKSWNTITFLLTKAPFKDNERVMGFCEEMCFDLVLLPNDNTQTEQCNILQDSLFSEYLRILLSEQNEEFYKQYDFNIQPATDQQPFFHQFLKWNSIQKLKRIYGKEAMPFFEIGYYIIILTFFQVLIIAFVLIMLPLLLKRVNIKNKWRIAAYFGGIGLGYMFIEIVFIHWFVLYFGNAIYATAAVISIMLLFSGIGSYFSKKLITKYRYWVFILGAIIVLLVLSQLFSFAIIGNTIGFASASKFAISLLILAPISFLMGIPFPIGISRLTKKSDKAIPWAWGINGYLSVISVPLATIISVESGFKWVFMLAAFAYLFALISAKGYKR
jgi:hypothetical protein